MLNEVNSSLSSNYVMQQDHVGFESTFLSKQFIAYVALESFRNAAFVS